MYDNSGVIKRHTMPKSISLPCAGGGDGHHHGGKTENFSCFCCNDDGLTNVQQHRKSWFQSYV